MTALETGLSSARVPDVVMTLHGAGQQSLMPRIGAVISGLGGGQLMAVLVLVCAVAADAAGGVPLTHLGSVHSITDAATGGTPLMQFGLGQELAAVAVRLREPAVRATEMTATAVTRLA